MSLEKNSFKVLIISILILLHPSTAHSSGEHQSAGAVSKAMGGLALGHSNVFSAANNQSELAHLKSPALGLSWSSDFLVEGLQNLHFVACLPVDFGAFGIEANNYGFSSYKEQGIGISYARKLSETFALGIQFNFQRLELGEYGSASSFSFELGLNYTMLEDLLVAAHIYNPFASTYDLTNGITEQSAAHMELGLSYNLSDKVNLGVGFAKDLDFAGRFRMGLEYQVHPLLDLRAGFSTQPALPSFGFGLNLKNLDIDFAMDHHQRLGLSPGLSLAYNF